jgi:DNA end-binding protein Ku
MPRAIWTGAISFGLVTVPVKVFTAVSSKTVRFNQLHGADGGRVEQRRVCSKDGEEVPFHDIVKGYEIAPDRYVVVEPEELAALEPGRDRTIEIEGFVSLAEIDPIFYDHPYYLAPAEGGVKPYRLLVEAMRETQRVGIARFVLRSKEQVVALRPLGEVLAMSTMVYADEIVDPTQLDGVAAEVETTERELAIAKQLIETLSEPFEPGRYHDRYREAVLALIERKAAGEELTIAPQEEAPKPTGADLIGALQASIEEVRKRTGAAPPRKRAAPKTPAPAKAKAARKSSARS